MARFICSVSGRGVNIKIKLALTAILFSFFMAGSTVAQEAGSSLFKIEVDGNYKFSEDKTLEVSHIAVVNNQDLIDEDYTIKISPVGFDVRGLEASYQDGIPLNPTIKDGVIEFNLNPIFSGSQEQWSFSIKYIASLDSELQEKDLLYLPPFNMGGSEVTRDSTVISLPQGISEAQFYGRELTNKSEAIGETMYSFKSIDKTADNGLIVFFKDQYSYEFNSNREDLVLPADTGNQSVFLESLSSDADRVSLDRDFNILTNSSGARGYITISTGKLDINLAEDRLSGSATEGLKGFLGVGGDWGIYESKASRGVLDDVDFIEKVLQESSNNPPTDFNESLVSVGNFALTMRKNQIPSRIIFGGSYIDTSGVTDNPQDYMWVEVYLGGLGWVPVDVNRYEEFDFSGRSNPAYIAKAVWGTSETKPELNRLLGKDDYSLSELNIFEGIDNNQKFEAVLNKKTLIPFVVSLDEFSVIAPGGNISDGNTLKYGDKLINFGTVAPLSKVSKKQLSIGSNSIGNISHGYIVDDEFTELYSGSINTSYTYFIALVLGTLASVVLLLLGRNKASSTRKIKQVADREFVHPNSN